jgi:WD40 repeat protein/tRNA A-37 threonylcarbamoyl transferase component Bud32
MLAAFTMKGMLLLAESVAVIDSAEGDAAMAKQQNTSNRSGQQIGKYRLLNRLGQGAFSEVYRVQHPFLGEMAMKIHYANDVMILKEARLVYQRLQKHPHIVQVHDFDVHEEVVGGVRKKIPYLVMDYAPHGTLKERYPRGNPVDIRTILPHLKQIAQALQYAHTQRPPIIHRDIKPENILLGEQEAVLLSDFGIALEVSAEKTFHQAEVAGTMVYAAPEQMQGLPGIASDQYALAVMTYEWLTGSLPFSSPHLKLHAHPVLPRARNQAITLEVEQAILQALSRDPHQRFDRVEAFVEALEQASKLAPAKTPPETHQTDTPHSQQPEAPISSDAPTVLDTKYAAAPPGLARAPYHVTVACTYKGHQENGTIHALAWSPKGERIASASGDATVQIWQPVAPNGHRVFIYRDHKSAVRSVAWSPDGIFIASSSVDGSVQVWNASTGNARYTFLGDAEGVYPVAWSPDGAALAFGCADGTVKIWAKMTGRVQSYALHHRPVAAVAWSSDGRFLASAESYTGASGASAHPAIHIWLAANGTPRTTYARHPFGVNTLAWRTNTPSLVSAGEDRLVHLWDAEYGNPLITYEGHEEGVNAVAWSPDGWLLASGGFDRTVRVWNLSTGTCAFVYYGHRDVVNAVAWSPDGRQIASGGWDATVLVWQMA